MQAQSKSRNPWNFVVDHNPFYLLSGAVMLVGCYLINASTTQADPDRVEWLYGLIAVFNVYEVLVIALGLWLARRMNLMRDAGYLLVLEVLLLCDFTLLYHRLFTFDSVDGLVIVGPLWVAAIVKVMIVLEGLGVRLRWRAWGLVAADLAVLLLLPGLWRLLVDLEWLNPDAMYLGWWAAAALIGVRAMRWVQRPKPRPRPATWALGQVVVRFVKYAPLTAVLLHLYAAHWSYRYVDLRLYHVAPVLLGVAMWLATLRVRRQFVTGRRTAVAALGAAAVLLSLGGPAWETGWITVSPLRIVLVACAVVWVAAYLRHGGMGLPIASALALCVAMLGHDVATMKARVASVFEMLRRVRGDVAAVGDKVEKTVDGVLPDTAAEWGWVLIVAAFLLLGAGAVVSWLKRERGDSEPRVWE